MTTKNTPAKIETPVVPVGLEDFDPTESSGDSDSPLRVRIGKFDDGDVERIAFVASSSGDDWDNPSKLEDVVILGLVKQRNLWATELDGQGPMCKSYNFKEGHPEADRFPWGASGLAQSEGIQDCAKCELKNWGTHPNPERDAPWCTEVYVLPVLINPNDDEDHKIAFVSLQRSGLKATKAYIMQFARDSKPLFANFTNMGVEKQKFSGSGTSYGTPTFELRPATPEADHELYATLFTQAREFLTSGPSASATAEVVSSRGELVAAVLDAEEPF